MASSDVEMNEANVSNDAPSNITLTAEVHNTISDAVGIVSQQLMSGLRERDAAFVTIGNTLNTMQQQLTELAAKQNAPAATTSNQANQRQGENPDSDTPSDVPASHTPENTSSEPSGSILSSRPIMKATVHPPKPFDGKNGVEVDHFLRKMKQYLHLCGISPADHVEFAAQFLEGQPDKLWSTEKDLIAMSKTLVWSDFESFLQRSFGRIAPMTDYFKEFEDLKQETTVIDYISRMKTCANKLKGTFLEPNEGTLVVKFLRGLKPHFLKLVQNAAPDGWWTSVDQVYARALTFETNRAAMMDKDSFDAVKPDGAAKRKQPEGKQTATQPVKKLKQKSQMKNPNTDVRIPKDEWMRRLKNKRCVMCGKERHGECTNKVATPF